MLTILIVRRLIILIGGDDGTSLQPSIGQQHMEYERAEGIRGLSPSRGKDAP